MMNMMPRLWGSNIFLSNCRFLLSKSKAISQKYPSFKQRKIFPFNYFLRSFSIKSDKNDSEETQKRDIIKEIYTIPNIITISRMASSPLLAWFIYTDQKEYAFFGTLLLGFSDWLDGYIAKRYNQMSVLGAFLDPAADKIIIGSITLGLALKGLLPPQLAAVIIGRDVLLFSISFYIRSLERPVDAPFFDTTYSATFQITPSIFSKINTGLQFTLLSTTLASFSFGVPDISLLEPLWYITGATTILSGLGYLDGSGLKRLSKPNIGRGPSNSIDTKPPREK